MHKSKKAKSVKNEKERLKKFQAWNTVPYGVVRDLENIQTQTHRSEDDVKLLFRIFEKIFGEENLEECSQKTTWP